MQYHTKVIQFPSGDWKFFDYLEGKNNPIEEWYQGLSDEGRDTFDTLLKVNGRTPLPIKWTGHKVLQGKYKQQSLWEWRFFADGRQQRVIGIFGDERRQSVFLIGCYHKGGNYTPADCLNTAIKRAKAVREGALTSERQIEPNL